MKACKHLDHTPGKYGPDITLESDDGFSVPVKFWRRGERWTDGGGPRDVQFCGQGRGRINGIFQCYNPGEMSCHEAEVQEAR